MNAEFSKAYCIKDYYDHKKRLRFVKGETYDTKRYLSHTHNDTILIKFNSQQPWFSETDTSEFIAGSIAIFELIKPDYSSKEFKEFFDKFGPILIAGPVYPYFVDYFATNKELRKLKLEKIEDINSNI